MPGSIKPTLRLMVERWPVLDEALKERDFRFRGFFGLTVAVIKLGQCYAFRPCMTIREANQIATRFAAMAT